VSDQTTAKAKLTQYLTEAYHKERELEVALQAHIGMTTKKPYKKRLQDHLRETKGHAKTLERRIKAISGAKPDKGIAGGVTAAAVQATGQAKSLAKGPLHMLRGTSEEEKLLKNAKTEYWNEHEEIATYTAIETLAEAVGDKETAKEARQIRREEERMASFLERQIPILTRAVAQAELPASERSTGRTRRSPARRKASGNGGRASSRSRSGASSSRKSSARASTSRKSSSRSGSSRKSSSRSGSSRSSGSSRKRTASRARS
jgi:ferritin-like metal-binding protein YciE